MKYKVENIKYFVFVYFMSSHFRLMQYSKPLVYLPSLPCYGCLSIYCILITFIYYIIKKYIPNHITFPALGRKITFAGI